MILVDIGNSSVLLGIENKGKIVSRFKVSTHAITINTIRKIANQFPYKKNILICSVVPQVNKLFKKLNKKVIVVGKDIKVPIQCLYNPYQVGQDRLVNAYAAKKLFPRVRLVIDFGTAITFDFISKKGQYLGGFIFPGISLSYSALAKCALLPKDIKISSKTTAKIPKTTKESINKGILEGLPLMINAWVIKYKSSLGYNQRSAIVITGGEAKYVLRRLKFPYIYEPDLILKGLLLLKQLHLE